MPYTTPKYQDYHIEGIQYISPKGAFEALKEPGQQAVLVDVRENDELEIAKPDLGESVLHWPMSGMSGQLQSLPQNKTLFIMCAHGIRSAQLTAWLMQQTYCKEVYNMDGGFEAWQNEGLPVFTNIG